MSTRIFVGIGIVGTITYWLFLSFQFPLFRIIPGYFWHAMLNSNKPFISLWYLMLAVIFAGFVVWFVLNYQSRVFLNLFLLIICGWSLQMSFGLIEGRGIDGIRDRMVNTGHAEFARLAVSETSVSKITTEYEQFLQENSRIRYANTKPPGQLILYMLTQKVVNLISPKQTYSGKFDQLTTFASFIYPFLSYLVLIPLYFFGRELLPEEVAIIPSILFIFVPNVTLVTLHYDQVFYPLLFMTTLYLSLLAGKKKSLYIAVVSGAAVYLSVFVSFSLLPLAILCPIMFLVGSRDTATGELDFSLNLRLVGGYLGGILLFYLIFRYLLSYDPSVRYQNVIAYHETWKAWQPGIRNVVLYALLNIVEFACWVGIPLMIFCGVGIGSGIKRLFGLKVGNLDLIATSLFVIFTIISIFGNTKGEVHRLWIFAVPLVCILTSSELFRRFTGKFRLSLAVLVISQLVTILLIKRYQDFW